MMVIFLPMLSVIIIAFYGNNVCYATQVTHLPDGDFNSDALAVKDGKGYVGGRNFVLELNFNNQSNVTVKRMNFSATEETRSFCIKYSVDSHCDNAVRILKFTSLGSLLACGTNAEYAKCYIYHEGNESFTEVDLDARKWMPKSPWGRVLSLLSDSGEFYVASVPSRTAGGILYKKTENPLKSEKAWFNEPEFVGIHDVAHKNYIYLFFNEKSKIFLRDKFDASNQNEGYYSMVARVCKSDRGGSWKKDSWMTFSKARLICPWHVETSRNTASFYYDELVCTCSSDNSVFGLFRPDRYWNLAAYAVAEFDTFAIDNVINGSIFSNKRPHFFDPDKPNMEVWFQPSGENSPFVLGQCPNGTSYELKSEFERFALENTLIKANIMPRHGTPFFVGRSEYPYNFIFVIKFLWCKLLLLMTDNGYLKKISLSSDRTVTEVSEQRILHVSDTIMTATLLEKKDLILLSTSTKVFLIPVSNCSSYKKCSSCNKDPYCTWVANSSTLESSCRDGVSGRENFGKCWGVPDSPSGLVTNLIGDEVVISWTTTDESPPGLFTVVTLRIRATQAVILKIRTENKRLLVPRSSLQDGREYEVSAAIVNGTSLSKKKTVVFFTDLIKPRLSVVEEDEALALIWTRIPGASEYVIEVVDDQNEILQEVTVSASSKELAFGIPRYQNGSANYITLKALSDDKIESAISKEFLPIKTVGTADVACVGSNIALAAFVTLFCCCFFIIIHNIWSIKPRVEHLKHDIDGDRYKRHCLLIWKKSRETADLKDS